jgi:nitrate reductase gamma subunit
LFFWVGAYEIGMIAGLLSFIGLSGTFLLARHFTLKRERIMSALGAIMVPFAAAVVLAGWEAMFPPPPCSGDDCVTIVVHMEPER